MPPIIEDYADIKRRLNILEGKPALSRGDGEIIEYIVDGWVWRDIVTPEGRIGLGKNRPMAQGGIVPKGTPYIVGDGAPELFVPDLGTRIEISADGSGGGGCDGHMVDDILSDEGQAFMKRHGAIDAG